MTTRTEAEANELAKDRVALTESQILAGTISSANVGGVWIVWHRQPKRDGGTLRRKGVWGRFLYWKDMDLYGEPLTREAAIRFITFNWSTPPSVREAMEDAQRQRVCSICSAVGQGAEQLYTWCSLVQIEDWHIRFGGALSLDPTCSWGESLDVCDGCIAKMRQGLIGRTG